jgi:hypothetical protein
LRLIGLRHMRALLEYRQFLRVVTS